MTDKQLSIISLSIKRPELLALHSCIAIVLNNNIPSPQDAGLLMEIMSDIARQDKDTKKEFNLKLKENHLIPCWHCCKIVLDNELQRDHIHATEIMTIISKIATEIDKQEAMKTRPNLRLVE